MQANISTDAVLVIIGPTAVGKTDLAIDLAEKINGEIISADSRLFYRGMDIGTAKPSLEQRQRVQHYLIDVAEPEEIWSLSVFQKKVEEAIRIIKQKGKIAIIVGGTGQYVRAITEGWQIPPQLPEVQYRKALENWGRLIGAEQLHHKLRIIDPLAADRIDPQNLRRTIRALEVIFMTGERFSVQRKKTKPTEKFWIIGLYRPRQETYARIDERIENMFTAGLIDETQKLLNRGLDANHPNLSAIGYQEAGEYLSREISLEEAKTLMKKRTREFVRRQTNWFKPSDPEIHWYKMETLPLEQIIEDLRVENIVHSND
ncbi:MAG: tRNA (adenosine(37)-N6)-dimethylallyltransferase MiaA [Anaerolineaceae bacterium]